ncbi:hypothetical protein C5167_033858, partial [Papaver somniferum]
MLSTDKVFKSLFLKWFLVRDKKPNTLFVTSPPYKVSEYANTKSAVRIARIVLERDDDTVFFPDNRVSVLSKYDHNQMYYIRDNSEIVEQDVSHSYNMAYMVVVKLDDCISRYSYMHGSDERISACVADIGALTKEAGFHQ